MTFPNLPKAPIVEGLIDIQVRQRAAFSLEQLIPFVDLHKSNYPVVKDIHFFQAAINFEQGKGGSQKVEGTKAGYRLERQSPPFVVLARDNGITISRLAPYDKWEGLAEEAERLWLSYCDICKPEAAVRVATRFINRLELPADWLDDDYLTSGPMVPKGLPQVVNHFVSRLVIPHDPSGSNIAISQVIESTNLQTRKVVVIIDIDIYKDINMPCNSAEIWNNLTVMRGLKNQAFFDSLTPKALELFK